MWLHNCVMTFAVMLSYRNITYVQIDTGIFPPLFFGTNYRIVCVQCDLFYYNPILFFDILQPSG